MPSQFDRPKLVQEYVGVPVAISEQARAVADEMGVPASEVLREMIIAGRTEGLRRLRDRAAEVASLKAA